MSSIYPEDLVDDATDILELARENGVRIATAESCTGGLISGLFTEIAGSSDVFDCGFVTYSNTAKADLLGVATELLETHGAVSKEVALAMADGALKRSHATVVVAVTGIAGPGGGSKSKPVGLVHMAGASSSNDQYHEECHFGNIGRGDVRLATVKHALTIIRRLIQT